MSSTGGGRALFKARVVNISDRVLHDSSTERVFLPGVLGEFEVEGQHIPIVSLLAEGTILVESKDAPKAGEKITLVEFYGKRYHKIPIKQGIMHFNGLELYAVVE